MHRGRYGEIDTLEAVESVLFRYNAMEKKVKERLQSLDGVRAISCIFIVLFHLNSEFDPITKIEYLQYGFMFVEVFVVLPGFLTAYNYKNRISGMSFIDFFKGRYLKIMPVFWLVTLLWYCSFVLVKLFINPGVMPDNPITIDYLITEAAGVCFLVFGYGPRIGVFWTVSLLLLCYVLFYFVCSLCKDNENKYFFFVIVFLLFGLMDFGFVGSRLISFQRVISAYSMGMLLFETYKRISKITGFYISILYVVMFVTVVIFIAINGITELETVFGSIYRTATLFIAPMLVLAAIYINPVRKFLSTKPFAFMARISMDMYMRHWLFIVLIGSRGAKLNNYGGGGSWLWLQLSWVR